jgi:hypothetical protein
MSLADRSKTFPPTAIADEKSDRIQYGYTNSWLSYFHHVQLRL